MAFMELRLQRMINGIDLGSDDSSASGGNVVVIHAGAVVRGDPAVQFDNGSNTVTVMGLARWRI